MQIGLLGKANVGKSTFFYAATETPVQIGNFPFTTIKPNIGVAHVKAKCACTHFGIKHQNQYCIDGTRFMPIKLVDVAGLVPDAHLGKGLGIKFLDDARQADALIHVVDIAGTTDIQGHPVSVGAHDPLQDVKFVHEEFNQWFRQILTREWPKISKEIEQKTTKLVEGIAKRFSGLGVRDHQVHLALQKTGLVGKKHIEWTDEDIDNLVSELRRQTKPILIAANKADLCSNLDILDTIDSKSIPCSAESELLLRKASKSGIIEYLPGTGNFVVKPDKEISPQQKKALELVSSVLAKIGSTGIQAALDAAVFDLLNFIVVYPVEDEAKLTNKDGQVLPDAKLLPKNSTAQDLAEMVHADIAKGFLYAIDCKTKRRIGHDHMLQDGDVIKIVSSMSRG